MRSPPYRRPCLLVAQRCQFNTTCINRSRYAISIRVNQPDTVSTVPSGIEDAGAPPDIPNPPSMHDSNSSNSPSTSISPSSGTGGLATQAFTSSAAFQETQTPSMAVPGPRSTEATGPGHNHSNTLAPTPQALPVCICLRLNPTEATESNKQKPNTEPPTLSTKKQKIANPKVEPTTANSIRYAPYLLRFLC